jgi:DNA-binding NarL/FixJ family response regulator
MHPASNVEDDVSAENKPSIKRILIADDSECARSIIRKSLETQPLIQVCGEAEDGMDAIEQAQKLRPDLILLDLAMPRMNGLEAASVLKQESPDVPIVLLTIHENALVTIPRGSAGMTLGVTAAISKHEGMAAVLKCVLRLLKLSN